MKAIAAPCPVMWRLCDIGPPDAWQDQSMLEGGGVIVFIAVVTVWHDKAQPIATCMAFVLQIARKATDDRPAEAAFR